MNEDLTLAREPIPIVEKESVYVDVDLDGVERVVLSAANSRDEDGEIDSYRWSRGLETIGVGPVYEGDFEVGETVVALEIRDDSGMVAIHPVTVRVLEPYTTEDSGPEIELWTESVMTLTVGRAQRWVDIPGNVSDADGVNSLRYRVNDGSLNYAGIGPNDRRLVREGDFNLDVFRSALRPGLNTVEIRAEDSNTHVTTAFVIIYLEEDALPELPITIDWDDETLDGGLVEIVDGQWNVDDGSASIDTGAKGYDRLLAIGDVRWSDYDVRTTVTIEEVTPESELNAISSLPGVGMIVRWNGHNDSVSAGSQPQAGFRPDEGFTPTPLGGSLFSAISEGGGFLPQIRNHRFQSVAFDRSTLMVVGQTYELRIQVQTVDGGALYRSKVWPLGTLQPDWGAEFLAGDADYEPRGGSVLLVAHESAATFGPVTIDVVPDGDRVTVETADLTPVVDAG